MTKQVLNKIDKDQQHEYWAEHVQEWKRSNLKQQAYCLKADISYSSFVYWKSLLAPKKSQNTQKAFVPVRVTSTESDISDISNEIKIKLTTGHVVCIPITMVLTVRKCESVIFFQFFRKAYTFFLIQCSL
jgi:hypothetical protein